MTEGEATLRWLERIEVRAAAGPAIRAGARVVDYPALVASATTLAARLTALGVERGDLVAVLAPPSVEGIALIHALLDRGVVLLPLNARLAEAEHLAALRDSGARFLLVSRDATAQADGTLEGLAESAGCGLLTLGRASAGEPSLEVVRAAPADAGTADAFEARRARRRAEGAALVLRTSGTSGRPKGAVLGLDNLVASAEGSAALLGSRPEDRWLLCMPLFHIGGLSILVRAALVGATVVLHARFDERAVAAALEQDGITHVSFVATMLERVLEARAGRRAPAGLRLVLLGGGPASASLLADAEALGYPVAPTYGLTEAASQVATRPPARRLASGEDPRGGLEPLPGVALRVVDAQGRSLAVGEEGEIELRGPNLMRGYLDDPEATHAALSEGWLSTGDIGRLDAEGRLRVLDRRSDLIVSGGENVYPAEIESVLAAHPDVAEAGVCGVPDETFGARPLAWVVTSTGARFDRSALLDWCRSRLAGYKCPVDVRETRMLPRGATGKLLRRALAADDFA